MDPESRSLLDPERRACVRRVSRRAMAVLDYDRIWAGPMAQGATQAAIVSGVERLVRSGEQDETSMLERVLQTVCKGRVTSALRAARSVSDEVAPRRPAATRDPS